MTMIVRIASIAFTVGVLTSQFSQAQPTLLAVGTLDSSRAGSFADVSGLHYSLENGVKATELGGFGSAVAYAGGYTFLALPDRGPNAVTFDAAIDNTASYINRFHTITMDLAPNTSGSGLPYTLTPTLRATTLLWSLTPLVYGSGSGLGVGSGVPPINNFLQHFFTGRSDNFDPSHNSGDPNDARFDTEGMRMSNDGLSVFISDEYGPYVYQFNRLTGVRVRSFQLPSSFFVSNLRPVGATEIKTYQNFNASASPVYGIGGCEGTVRASSTMQADVTYTHWRKETWHIPGAARTLVFDEELLQRQLDNITGLLTPLVSAARDFAENNQPKAQP